MSSLEPVEELKTVILREGEPEKMVSIGSQLDPLIKESLIKLLREYADVFSFSTTDLVRLSLKVVEHHLNVDPDVRPVRQRRRHFGAELDKEIDEEVQKLLEQDTYKRSNFPHGYLMR